MDAMINYNVQMLTRLASLIMLEPYIYVFALCLMVFAVMFVRKLITAFRL